MSVTPVTAAESRAIIARDGQQQRINSEGNSVRNERETRRRDKERLAALRVKAKRAAA